jgi:hypothetical protein
VQLQDALAHEARLEVLGGRPDQGRHLALRPGGDQVLAVPLCRAGDHLVRQGQDLGGAAVVLGELDDAGAGELLGKLQDVLEARPAEGVDALGVVPDGHHVVVAVGQQPHHAPLQPVGVLVLVHHDVAEHRPDPLPLGRVLLQQGDGVGQQVVVVHQLPLALELPVAARQAQDAPQVLHEVGVLGGDGLLDGHVPVHRLADDVQQGTLLGEQAALGIGQLQLGADQAHHVLGVGSVQDGERRLQADGGAEAAQQAAGGGVEGAPLHPVAAGVQQQPGALAHLLGGAAGEGEQQDRVRRHALGHQVGGAVDEGAGLAGAGAGHHQHRAVHGAGRLRLGRVELGQEGLALLLGPLGGHRNQTVALHTAVIRERPPRGKPGGGVANGRAPRVFTSRGPGRNPGGDLLSHAVSRAVPSALEGLTAVFGMGTGVSPQTWPPGKGWQPGKCRSESAEVPWCVPGRTAQGGMGGQAARPISTGQLNALPRLHTRPIHVVVYDGPSGELNSREI